MHVLKDDVQELKTDMHVLKDDVQELKTDMHVLKDDVQANTARLDTLSTDVHVLKDDVQELKTDVQELKDDVQELKTDVHVLKDNVQANTARLDTLSTDVHVLKDDVQELKTDMHVLKDDVQELKTDVQELKANVQANTARLDTLSTQVQANTARLDTLSTQVQANTARLDTLSTEVHGLKNEMNQHKGLTLEWHYQYKAGSYFGQLLRRPKVIDPHTLDEQLEQYLTHEEFLEVIRLDLLVSGKLRTQPDQKDVWLAIEISAKIDAKDVNRAVQRATLLRKAGYVAVAVVAGEECAEQTVELARETQTVIVQNGRIEFWEEALAEIREG
jgi:outer membrane murein-binding lipoprotein Lpp